MIDLKAKKSIHTDRYYSGRINSVNASLDEQLLLSSAKGNMNETVVRDVRTWKPVFEKQNYTDLAGFFFRSQPQLATSAHVGRVTRGRAEYSVVRLWDGSTGRLHLSQGLNENPLYFFGAMTGTDDILALACTFSEYGKHGELRIFTIQ